MYTSAFLYTGNDTFTVCMHEGAFKDCLAVVTKWCLKSSNNRGKFSCPT